MCKFYRLPLGCSDCVLSLLEQRALCAQLVVLINSVVFLWVGALRQADPPRKATYGEPNRLIISELTITRLWSLGTVCESGCTRRNIKTTFWLSKRALSLSLANNFIKLIKIRFDDLFSNSQRQYNCETLLLNPPASVTLPNCKANVT